MSARTDVWVATEKDVPALLGRLRVFYGQTGMTSGMDDAATADFVRRLIADGVIFMADRGCIGGILSPHWFNPAHIMAIEIFWHSEGDGLPLLRRFEAWAEDVGASELRMTTQAALPRGERLMRALGYAPSEISYSRGL